MNKTEELKAAELLGKAIGILQQGIVRNVAEVYGVSYVLKEYEEWLASRPDVVEGGGEEKKTRG